MAGTGGQIKDVRSIAEQLNDELQTLDCCIADYKDRFEHGFRPGYYRSEISKYQQDKDTIIQRQNKRRIGLRKMILTVDAEIEDLLRKCHVFRIVAGRNDLNAYETKKMADSYLQIRQQIDQKRKVRHDYSVELDLLLDRVPPSIISQSNGGKPVAPSPATSSASSSSSSLVRLLSCESTSSAPLLGSPVRRRTPFTKHSLVALKTRLSNFRK